MIRTESEYQNSITRFRESEQSLRRKRDSLVAEGRNPDQIKRLTDPTQCFHDQLRDEIESYERLRNRDPDELAKYHSVGDSLIALRIFRGLTQRELAERLGCHESQVSRDERNEYHGVTVDRATRILEMLGAELRTSVISSPDKALTKGQVLSTSNIAV